MDIPPTTQSLSNAASLAFKEIGRFKWLVIIGFLLSAGVSILIAVNQPNIYTAKMIVVPSKSKDSGGLSKLAGQFGGLASMAGISLGSSGDQTAAAIEFMKSRNFLHNFIEKRELLPYLLALEGWDRVTRKPIFNIEIYDSNTKTWTRTPAPGKNQIPTPWEGYDALVPKITLANSDKKGIVEIKVSSLSPDLSQNIANWLIEDINLFWKEQDKIQADQAISYLEKKANETTVAELRTMFYELIAEQTRTKLVSAASDDYLFKALAPAFYPEEKSGPSRALICIAITMLGGLMSLILAFILALKTRGQK
ncbi:Wzz/FepE/Etk N-terminal domain-containing protein [Pseudoalteromonas fenneropenaei]|uniref:Wzz/FepE/Etk N-terminal domain-containing protein n=1 Tax=Pseudoalteromonas fenneropenaei TaxID=1737459 RepID=A0ABV7CKF3_9GAMM